MNTTTGKPLFTLGEIVATPACLSALTAAEQTGLEFLTRHVAGDWGECGAEDTKENDFSVKQGLRIFSVYRTRLDRKIWVITEADRSSTCLLLPEDY